MEKKIVTVVGATGIQGGSVIDVLLKDDKYHIRAVTRNCESQSAKDLTAQGVEVVQATTDDVSSLTVAFQGSSIIFGVTDFFGLFANEGPLKATEIESAQALNLAKAAAATPTLEHYIWSTLPDAKTQSSGKFLVPHFESKNIADRYIQSQPELLAKTTFVIVGYYAANFYWQTHTPIFIPSAGKHVQLNGYPADTPLRPIGDAKNNVGIFIKAIIDQPNKTLPGKHVLAHTENITCGEMLQLWGEAQGKAAEYIELRPEEFNKIWPGWAEEIGIMMQFFWWAKTTRSQNAGVLTRDDLGISEGLIGTKEAFSAMKF
ncbi:hypothetical protein V8C43DRAFT_313308 [Trichoderma afarasin]